MYVHSQLVILDETKRIITFALINVFMLILHTDFKIYRDNIPETDGWITETIMPLTPSSDYDVRVRATNQRPVMPNYSEYVNMTAKTKGE